MWSRDKLKIYLHSHNAYGHQTCQGDEYREELSPINLHDLSIRWSCEVASQLNLLYFHLQKTHDTKRGKMLTKHERLPPLKPHDLFITWTAWGLVTNSTIHIAFVTRFVATKLRSVLTLGRKFSTETLKCTITGEFVGLRMRTFLGIVFMWTQTYRDNFKSALVYLYVFTDFLFSISIAGATPYKNLRFYLKNSTHCFPFVMKQKVNKNYWIILNYYYRNR